MRMLLGLLAALSVVSPGPINPKDSSPAPDDPPLVGFMDVVRLKRLCETTEASQSGELESCLGYIAGVVDQFLLMDSLAARPSLCLPRNLNLEAVRQGFLEEIRENPRGDDTSAALIVDIAIASKYACARIADRGAR